VVPLLLGGLAGGAVAETGPSDGAVAEGHCHELATPGAGTKAVCIGTSDFFGDVCRSLEIYAVNYRLPPAFFARLIWQESRFDPGAISSAGAQGIAQFMPGTARLRGLRQAFQPAEALAYSAEYIQFLAEKYGNLGLAAAAYNSGEGRVSRWLASGGTLPAETRHYVRVVTGVPVESWSAGAVDDIDYALQPDKPFEEACIDMARNRPVPVLATLNEEWHPWGVLIAQDFSPDIARSRFERTRNLFGTLLADEPLMMLTVRNPSFGPKPRHSAMIGRGSREEAEGLCNMLRNAGGTCVVVKN
jgi:hypothetical protein